MTEAPEGDVPRGLVRSSGVMAAGTVVSRVLGFARNTVLAAAIGTDLVATTYNVANTIPNILYILIAGGVLNAVFVPQLVRAMKHGDGGQGYTDRLLTLAGLVLLGLTVLATAAAPLLIALYTPSNWGDEDVATATAFAFWCLPQIAFYGLYAMLGQVLNARGSFGPMMWAPIVNNLVAIATGLLFIAVFTVDFKDPGSVSAAAIALLGGGATLGVALQALVLVPVLRRTGFRYKPRFDFRGAGLGKARRAGQVVPAVRARQPARLRRGGQPGGPGGQGGPGRHPVRRRLHGVRPRLSLLHPAAQHHHRLGGDRAAAPDEHGRVGTAVARPARRPVHRVAAHRRRR